MNYWERLKRLKIPSLQRRRERYQIIHIWKIAESIIPNDLGLHFYDTPRFGLKCRIPAYNPRQRHLSTLKYDSFFTKGPSLFNILPEKSNLQNPLLFLKVIFPSFWITSPNPNNPQLPIILE